VVLLKKAASWWQEEKAELRASKSGQMFDAPDQLRSQFEGIIELMAKVILPRLKDADSLAKELAIGLLSEMEQCSFCILAAIPVQLFINPQLFDEVTSKLRGGLISNIGRDAEEAMVGLYFWLAHAQQQRIAAPPDDLLGALVNKVKTRTQPALVSALAQMGAIVRQLPDVLKDGHVRELSVGLDYLLTETKFTDPFIRDELEARRLIPNAEIPPFRRYASALASQIYSWCLREKKPMPVAILKWKEIAAIDVLPEVRFEWEPVNES